MTTNACLDELRRRRRRPLLEVDAFDAGGGVGPDRDAFDRVAAPPAFGRGDRGDGAIEATGLRFDVDIALARLPYDFRVAVVLRDVCDLDYAEIGRVLDLPPGTVRSRIARGRGQLADLLGNHAPPTERPTPAP